MYACIYAHDSAHNSVSDSALEAILLDFAVGFSPLVELLSSTTLGAAGTTITLDISGTESLFGPPESLAQEIFDRARALGLVVNVAIADNPDAAILIARSINPVATAPGTVRLADESLGGKLTVCPTPDPVATAPGTVRLTDESLGGKLTVCPTPARGVIVVPPDKTQSVLFHLPLEALDPALIGIEPDRAAEIIETLKLWGLQTLGDFAALPEKGVSETLGEPGLKLQKLARGTNRRSLRYVIPKREFRQSMELEAPIELVEQLSFVISGLLHQLCACLGQYGLAMIEIRLEAKLDDKSIYSRKLRLPFPMSSPQWLSRLLIMDVEMCPPASAIQSVTLEAEPVKPRPLQKGLFEPLTPEPEKLELTLARLARLVGVDNVGAPEVLNTHRPDAFRLKGFALPKKPATLNFSTPQSHSLLTLRMFRPPLPVEVKVSPSSRIEQTVSLRPPELRADSLPERQQHFGGVQSAPSSQDSVCNSPSSKLTVCFTEEPVATAPGTITRVAQTVSLRPPELRVYSLPERQQHFGGVQSTPPSQDSVCNSPSSKLTVCFTDEPVATAPATVGPAPSRKGGHGPLVQDAVPLVQDAAPPLQGSDLEVDAVATAPGTAVPYPNQFKGGHGGPPLQENVVPPVQAGPIRPIHLKPSLKQSAAASGRIVHESGPWFTSGNWWSSSDRWTREEWDVALSNGTLYRIFRDVFTGGWFVEGVYD